MTAAPAIATLAAVGVLLWATYTGNRAIEVGAKTLASAGFLVAALMWGVHERGTVGLFVVAGLAFGAIGDLLLLRSERKFFMGGLVVFLLSHLAYIGAFLALGVSPPGIAVGAAVVVPFAYGVWRYLGQHVGSMMGPVLTYMFVISTMVACAHGSLSQVVSLARAVLMLAAVLFFLSDLFVARHRFVKPEFLNRAIGLPLYYVAQLLFGLGASMLWHQ